MEQSVKLNIEKGEEIVLYKYVSVLSSLNNAKERLIRRYNGEAELCKLIQVFQNFFMSHAKEWERIWAISDVVIEGDIAAQQAIRFNIFHLNQTYTGKDERLNIGPKGFTGEKYGGSTYWDTEAFGLPFFLKQPKKRLAEICFFTVTSILKRVLKMLQNLDSKMEQHCIQWLQ